MPAAKHTVLLVDESPTLRRVVDVLLTESGLTVLKAESGREGLALAQESRPGLIIVNAMMPEMNGYVFCKAVRDSADLRRIPIILLTVSGSDTSPDHKLPPGVFPMLKPFDPDELIRLSHHVLQEMERATRPKTSPGGAPPEEPSTPEPDLIESAVQQYFQTRFPQLIKEVLTSSLLNFGLIRGDTLIWSGNLTEICLPDVLNFAHQARLSGRLSIISPVVFGDIFIEQGMFVFASVSKKGEHRYMVDLIKEDRPVDTEVLSCAVEEAREQSRPVGSVLVERGIVSPADLMKYIKRQAQEALNVILEQKAGAFYLEKTPLPEDFQDPGLRIPLLEAVFEALRTQDEKKLAASELSDPSIVFSRLIPDEETMDGISLDQDETRIYSLADGKITLEEIIRLSRLEPMEVRRICYSLLKIGLLRKRLPPARPDSG